MTLRHGVALRSKRASTQACTGGFPRHHVEAPAPLSASKAGFAPWSRNPENVHGCRLPNLADGCIEMAAPQAEALPRIDHIIIGARDVQVDHARCGQEQLVCCACNLQ